MTPQEMVAEFHRAFGCPINTQLTTDLPTTLVELRLALIDEEATEVALLEYVDRERATRGQP